MDDENGAAPPGVQQPTLETVYDGTYDLSGSATVELWELRKLRQRIQFFNSPTQWLTALTVPGAVLSGVAWVANLAIVSSGLSAAFGVAGMLVSLGNAETRLSSIVVKADELIMRIRKGATHTGSPHDVNELDAIRVSLVNEFFREVDVPAGTKAVFFSRWMAGRGLKAAAERVALQELRLKGYIE